MFVLAFLPFGKYSTIFQFTEDETRLLYGEGHMFSVVGARHRLKHADFVSYFSTVTKVI